MNQSPHPPFMPPLMLPRDAVQVQAFAAAGEVNFTYLNNALGFSVSTPFYRALQKHFFNVEKKNPTLGELRLLGHLSTRHPLSQRLSLGTLYTNSNVLMETWADIMSGYHAVYGQTDRPCTLADILALPEIYLRQSRGTFYDKTPVRLVSSSRISQALVDGYTPVKTILSPKGTMRQICQAHGSHDTPSPQVGDILLAIPATSVESLLAFLETHPLVAQIKGLSAVKDTSVLVAALELCGGMGMTINPLTLFATAEERNNPVGAYLSAWETDLPEGQARAVLCIPPCAQAPLFTVLSEHGFSPRVLGVVIKQSRVIFSDGVLTTVNLNADIIQKAVDVKTMCAELELLPFAEQKISKPVLTLPTVLPEFNLTGAEISLSTEGRDGFTTAIQGVLALCCEFASKGILYRELSVSPVISVRGGDSPLLWTAVCGLYRACTELAIPMIYPEVLFEDPSEADQTPSLTLSLMAYVPRPCEEVPTTFTVADHPLTLWTLKEVLVWDDIRKMLFSATQAVRRGQVLSIHPLRGDSVLSCLERGELSATGIGTGLFEEYMALFKTPVPVGFLMEGSCEPGQEVHIGTTQVLEYLPSACAPSAPAFSVIDYSRVTLNELKYKETQKRKEIAAMEKMKNFESLAKHPRTVLLDTDIGPDCDDVGALAVLIYYAKKYNFSIGGICNCTSNKAGNGVIDAICRRCGIDTPPLGQWHGEGFMDGIEHCKYNTAVAEAHSDAYRNGTLVVEDEVTYYRKRLSEAKDGEVMVISIGMFNNLAALLESPADDISPLTGMELVKAKVYALVSMAAILPQGRECNVVSDYKSCEKVFASWPTPIYLSDFHIGVNVKTGYGHITDPEIIMADPLPMSYHLYTQAWNWEGAVKGQNASYDLTAVQFAALGICELYDLDTPGDLEFYAEIPDLPDATRFIENPMGNKIFMTKKVADEVIANSLQEILSSF